jgi:hypothetical protein
MHGQMSEAEECGKCTVMRGVVSLSFAPLLFPSLCRRLCYAATVHKIARVEDMEEQAAHEQ